MLLSVSALIKSSWELYKKHWHVLAVYVFFIFIPTLILSVISIFSLLLTIYAPATALFSGLILVVLLLASIIFSIWVSIALAKVIKYLIKTGQAPHWQAVFTESSHLIVPTIIVSVLTAIVVAAIPLALMTVGLLLQMRFIFSVGLLALFFPGVLFMIWYSFAVYQVIFENQKGFQALQASKKMVVGRWWSILWRLFVPGVIFVIIAAVPAVIIKEIVTLINLSPLFTQVLTNIIGTIIQAVATPLMATAIILLYLSAKEPSA